jgi:hypothetical protein
MDIATKFASS